LGEIEVPQAGPDLSVQVPAQERRLNTVAPGFLDQVRAAAHRIANMSTDASDARAVLTSIEELAILDLDVPTASRWPLVPLAKRAVKRVIAWYLGYFGRQITALGQAVSDLGGLLLDRTERLETATNDLRAEVVGLTERVAGLERGAESGQ
jgi:hypothetical protein